MRMRVYNPFSLQSRMRDMMESPFFDDWDDTEMDMYEQDDNVVVKLKAPGFDEKNVEITVDANTLTITGNVEQKEEEGKDKKYYRKEISSRSFTRTVSLPTKVESDKAKANFKSGILTLTLPKAEEVKPKKINIEPVN